MQTFYRYSATFKRKYNTLVVYSQKGKFIYTEATEKSLIDIDSALPVFCLMKSGGLYLLVTSTSASFFYEAKAQRCSYLINKIQFLSDLWYVN